MRVKMKSISVVVANGRRNGDVDNTDVAEELPLNEATQPKPALIGKGIVGGLDKPGAGQGETQRQQHPERPRLNVHMYDVGSELSHATHQLQYRSKGTPERHVVDVIPRCGQGVGVRAGLRTPSDDGWVHARLGPERATAFEHHLGAARTKFGQYVYDTEPWFIRMPVRTYLFAHPSLW
jgi:hypothetical protein